MPGNTEYFLVLNCMPYARCVILISHDSSGHLSQVTVLLKVSVLKRAIEIQRANTRNARYIMHGVRSGTKLSIDFKACDPDQFGFQWTSLGGISCDDADFCTYSDRCTSGGLCVGTQMPGKCWLATQDDVSHNWDRLSCSNGDLCAYHLDPVNTPTPKCPDNAITIPHDECSLVCQACNATSIVCKTIRGVGCLPDVTACGCTVVMWDVCFDNNTVIQNELRHPCQYCHLSRNYRSLIEFANNPEMIDSENCVRNDGCGSVSCIGEVGASAHPVPAPLMVIPSTGTCS